MQKIIIIDNYDSFTWNLYQYFCKLGVKVEVYRNDQLTLKDVEMLLPDKLVISPGPGDPNNSGISLDVIRLFSGKIPILGVCLGHQAIGQVFGAKIVRTKNVIHGKTVLISHDRKGLFKKLVNPLRVTRYNSLVIDCKKIPKCLTVSAWAEINHEKEIMAIRHKNFLIEGVQFHPESIASMFGYEMLENFLKY